MRREPLYLFKEGRRMQAAGLFARVAQTARARRKSKPNRNNKTNTAGGGCKSRLGRTVIINYIFNPF